MRAPDFPNASASALDYFTAQQDTRIYNASYGPAYDPPGNVTIMPAGFIDGAEAASLRQALAANKIIVAATGNDRENSPIATAAIPAVSRWILLSVQPTPMLGSMPMTAAMPISPSC